MSDVSKRFTVTVPDSIYGDLERWAEQQGRPAANLAAFLIEVGIRQAMERGELQPKTEQKGSK
ncbi:ribbon-helix-helix domain-containing protein [Pantanalinema rosaneae CENA516]|uniref:ribbon-helix-helix domain-containing protein n=1 Tax=Pantanalinema rosaneae TaxID=1620701 RepID=UPI003D6F13A8